MAKIQIDPVGQHFLDRLRRRLAVEFAIHADPGGCHLVVRAADRTGFDAALWPADGGYIVGFEG
ncbi:MAG: hypothetical protein DCC65_16795 [Planctomycetota bacterium]|nr:MAG: hypothetical protein DCC65_16795 [Planctomycetota bacterium]